jgi:hypothetical protein
MSTRSDNTTNFSAQYGWGTQPWGTFRWGGDGVSKRPVGPPPGGIRPPATPMVLMPPRR